MHMETAKMLLNSPCPAPAKARNTANIPQLLKIWNVLRSSLSICSLRIAVKENVIEHCNSLSRSSELGGAMKNRFLLGLLVSDLSIQVLRFCVFGIGMTWHAGIRNSFFIHGSHHRCTRIYPGTQRCQRLIQKDSAQDRHLYQSNKLSWEAKSSIGNDTISTIQACAGPVPKRHCTKPAGASANASTCVFWCCDNLYTDKNSMDENAPTERFNWREAKQ